MKPPPPHTLLLISEDLTNKQGNRERDERDGGEGRREKDRG